MKVRNPYYEMFPTVTSMVFGRWSRERKRKRMMDEANALIKKGDDIAARHIATGKLHVSKGQDDGTN